MTEQLVGWGTGRTPTQRAPRRPMDAQPHQENLRNPGAQRRPHLLASTLRGTKTLNMTPPSRQDTPQGQIHLVSHNLHKHQPEAPIVQHFAQGAQLIFIQEINTAPRRDLLPPGTFVHSALGQNRNGVAILGSPEIAPFLTPFLLPDNPGVLVGAQLKLPPLPPILLLSLYAGQQMRPVLETLLPPLLRHPHLILAGDFNSPFSPLDVHNMHYSPWPLISALLNSTPHHFSTSPAACTP